MERVVKDTDNPTSKNSRSKYKGVFTPTDYAVAFIYGMDKEQRNRFKTMLNNGITCGKAVAQCYDIEYEPFIGEVKRILKAGGN